MVAINSNLAPVYDVDSHCARGASRGLAGNIPNGTTDSCWFGWQTMEERNPSGGTDTPMKQYVWGTYVDECIQLNLLRAAGPQGLPSRHYYPLQDTLYRAVALTNSGGETQEAYDTDAYGNTLIFTGPGPDNTWFTDDDLQSSYGANSTIYCGYRYDVETDHYYVRNRYYSPTLGRWLTRDPIGYRGGVNLYAYVNSSPVGNVDTSGLAWFTWSEGGQTIVSSGNPKTVKVETTPGGAGKPRGMRCLNSPTCQRLYREAAFASEVVNNLMDRIHAIRLGLRFYSGPGAPPAPSGYSTAVARNEIDRLSGELSIMRAIYLGIEAEIPKAGCPYPNLWPSNNGPSKNPGPRLMPGTAGAIGEVLGEAVQEIIYASLGI